MTARPLRSHGLVGLAILLAVPALACSEDPSDTTPTTVVTVAPTTVAPTTTELAPSQYDIVGTALTATVFSQLAGMVVDAGLVDTLRGEGPFTVFAPTNAAFEKLPLKALHDVQDDPDLLATVLTYHVVAGKLTLADLQDGPLATVAGPDLEISHKGDQVLVNGFPVAAGDIMATNGVVHVMNDVLLPPS